MGLYSKKISFGLFRLNYIFSCLLGTENYWKLPNEFPRKQIMTANKYISKIFFVLLFVTLNNYFMINSFDIKLKEILYIMVRKDF